MSNAKTLSAQDNAAGFSDKKRTIALVVVALGFVMDLLDSTIVNIAIPSIKTNLGASYSAIQWILAGYSLAFALLLVTGGRMGDVFGYKKTFIFGVAGFTLASLLSGVSPNIGILIVARLLQGSMAALMVPQVMSLMQVMYKPAERGAINGLFGMLGGLAASLGPIVGGLLIKANIFSWDWRPIFLINVPVGIFGLIAATKFLPEGKSPHPLKLDLTGTLIIMAAMFLLVFPLIQGRELGWPAWSYVMIAGSLPALALFAWWQKHREKSGGSPLVLPELFRIRSFNVGLSINMIFEAAMLGFFLTFTLFLQIGLGFSAIHAALTGLPTAFAIALTMATLGEKVLPKLGRKSIFLGTVLMAVGLAASAWTFNHYGLSMHSWQLIPDLFVVGVGMGFVFGALFAAVLNGVDATHAGSASGTLSAVQQVGGAVGVAVVGVIFFGQLTAAAPASFNYVKPQLKSQLSAEHISASTQNQIIASAKQCFVDRTTEQDSSVTPASCKQSQVPTKIISLITKGAEKANDRNFTNAFRWTTVYEVGLLATTLALGFGLPKYFRTQAYTEI